MTFKVYKSSAGSGKTFTLVKEYLNIALSSDNPSNYKAIMAVTFTNKAANEMKERVIKYLRALAADEFAEGAEKLIQEQLLSSIKISKIKLQERAKKTLKSILHNYSDFNISTIDKFILKIIRSFSLDFQIPFNFDVEMDTESILNNAVENVIAEAGENKELTKFLLQYVTSQAQDDGNWNVTSALTSIAKTTLNDDATKYIRSLKHFSFQDFLNSKKKCDDEISLFLSKITGFIKQGHEVFESKNITASDLIGKSRSNIFKYFHPTGEYVNFTLASDKAIAEFETEEWAHKTCDTQTAQTITDAQHQLYGCFSSAEKLKTTDLEKVNSLQLVSKHLFQLA
ncbi:MAG: ATP-dependent exoDNAse (exonuclease V) beta subunit, partial [Saprospiraceae bacterium]